jgi:hypothetical protein
MKTLLKVLGSILICVVLVLLVLRFTGLEPHACSVPYHSWKCRIPGFWLRGNLVTAPVNDWSFTDKYQTIAVQTRTWYLIPHSVATTCTAYNGQLYLTSTYYSAADYARGRNWNKNVARDPHVRLKIGDQLFDRTLTVVTDPAEKAAALDLKWKKYPRMKVAPNDTVLVFRVTD